MPDWSRNCSASVRPVRADAGACSGRLVHLTVDERHLALRKVVGLDDVGFYHLVIEVVALTGPLADPGEHGEARVNLGDVVDQLHDQDRLADAGAAEEADLAALGVGSEKVHDLDAGHENL